MTEETDCIPAGAGMECGNGYRARDVFVGGRKYRIYQHRMAFEKGWGIKIPAGLQIRHTCDNPPCVNPLHLMIGSHLDNMADMRGRGRSLTGERNPMTKLSDEEVQAIRDEYIPYSRQHGARAIARRIGLHPKYVNTLALGRKRA